MLVTLKNLQQETFQVEVDANCTVKQLKEKIQADKGAAYPAACQKLIFAGKILTDDSLVSSLDMDDKKFIVCLVTKPNVAPLSVTPADPTQVPTSVASTESQTSSSSNAEADQARAPASAQGAAASTESGSAEAATAASAESTLLMGDAYRDTVRNIMDMGYSMDQVEQALRASFNNPDRAVEYLINGIPPAIFEDPPPAAEMAERDDNADSPESPPPTEDDPLAFLRTQPQFQQMRQVIQQNPELLNAVLQQIGQTNPALLDLISENRDAFVRMLNEPSGTSVSRSAAQAAVGALQTARHDPQSRRAGEGLLPHGTIQVTPQDKEAIDRLKDLGFPEHLVIQAYFACEKNENLAANFLLSQNFDD